MTADTTDETPDTPPEGQPENTPSQEGQPEQAEEGKGSKTAVLADLAAERDRRQAAETAAGETAAKLEAVLSALGLKPGPDTDPATEAEKWRQQARDASLRLAVHQHAPAGVDVAALLDSRTFAATLTDLDPDNVDAIAKAVTGFVDTNPRFRTSPAAGAARDAAAGGSHKPATPTMDDWLRGKFR